MSKKKPVTDAENIPIYGSPTNLGLVSQSNLQGYGQNITIDKLREMYLRQGFCYRIVNKISADTFDNGFVIDLDEKLAEEIYKLNDRINLLSELKQTFKYAYLYGCGFLAIGYQDSAEVDQEPQGITGIDYVVAISLNKIKSVNIEKDRNSKDYGSIKSITLKASYADGVGGEVTIHKDRLLPIIFDPFENNPTGYSQVAPAYNYLETLENFIWSAGQAYYRYAAPLHFLKIQGAKKTELDDIDKNLVDINALTRMLGNERYTLEVHNQTTADPKPFFDVMLTAVSSSLGIPKQIVEGTNAGALTGSETNIKNYNSDIASYQSLIVNPVLRKFYGVCMDAGILPKSDNYDIIWESLFEMNQKEQALTMLAYSQAYSNFVMAGVPEEEARNTIPELFADSFSPPITTRNNAAKIPHSHKPLTVKDRIAYDVKGIFSNIDDYWKYQDAVKQSKKKI